MAVDRNFNESAGFVLCHVLQQVKYLTLFEISVTSERFRAYEVTVTFSVMIYQDVTYDLRSCKVPSYRDRSSRRI